MLKAHRYNIPNEDTKNFVKYCECVRSNPNLYKRFQYEDPYFITNFYPQYTRKYKDFVYQTCKAYIDTIYKIYGSRKAEEFDEIYEVADFKNIINSYSPKKAIDLIESSFHHGILSYVTDNLTIRDAMTMSVIVQFSTSKSGYEMIKSGYLIEKPEGKESEFFVVYIKSYSLSGDYMICSFANGYEFGLRASATHKCEFTILYYTSKSIDGKTYGKKLEPKYKKAYMCYDCKEVDCFWMDEETASYSQDYVFAYRPNVNSEMPYFGIEINQYILHHKMLHMKESEMPKYVDCRKSKKPLLA